MEKCEGLKKKAKIEEMRDGKFWVDIIFLRHDTVVVRGLVEGDRLKLRGRGKNSKKRVVLEK